MKNPKGYYEIHKVAENPALPVTVMAGNVVSNGLHWHDHLEIFLCLKGQSLLRVDGMPYLLHSGDFVTINGGTGHEIESGTEGNLQIICSVDPDVFQEADNAFFFCSTLGNDPIANDDAQEIRLALKEMAWLSTPELSALTSPALSEASTRKAEATVSEAMAELSRIHPLKQEQNWFSYHMYMYRLLALLGKYKKLCPMQDKQLAAILMLKKRNAIKACVSYIHAHYGEPLNARVLADELHVSEPTVYRLFAEQLSMPLSRYITMVRIQAACRYLEKTSDSVTDIAYSCGFTSLSNFYRAFGEFTGLSPKAYRAAHKTNSIPSPMHQQHIMLLNRFQSFYELGYGREELLADGGTLPQGQMQ